MGLIQNTASATIANGAALSAPVCVGSKVLCALIMPAAWTAADLTFQVNYDNGTTWGDLHDGDGNEIRIPAPAAAENRALDPSLFASCMFLKVRSGTSGTPVNQAAARTLTLVTRNFYPRQ
jgi:hypothetical protein